jgi:hypothetical protein
MTRKWENKDWLVGSIISCLVIAGILLAAQYNSLVKTSAPISSQQQKNISGILSGGFGIAIGQHTLVVQGKTASGKTVQASTSFTVSATTDPYKALIIYPAPRTAAQNNEVATACRSLGDSTNVFDIKQFGAKGDGSTDDYAAMRGAAAFISQPENAGKTLYYPPGTYKVNKVIDRNAYPDNAQADLFNIRYVNPQNIKLIGCSAIINVKGDFKKSKRVFVTGDIWKGDLAQVSPFDIRFGSGFLVSGFEIYGNLDKMLKDNSVNIAEDGGRGISTSGGQNYTLENLNIHGFSTDGMFLGVGFAYKPDINATVRNVISKGNGRQGLSIQQMRGGTFTNVQFLSTGVGAYGGHSPRAGVDIEPIYCVSGCPDSMNRQVQGLPSNTGDITFTNSTFADNLGAQLISAGNLGTENITIQNSTFNNLTSGSRAAVGLDGKNGIIANNTFITAKTAIAIESATATVDIHNNTITSVGAVPFRFPVVSITAGNVSFKNNHIIIPASAYNSQNSVMVNLATVTMSALNIFETTLSDPVKKAFTVSYGSATKVQQDKYVQPNYIKPAEVTTFTNPYSK